MILAFLHWIPISMNPISFIISALILIFIILLIKRPQTTHPNSPPSPPKLPILGNLLNLGLQPHINLRNLAQRYGPLMLLHLGAKPVLVVSSADTAREILKTQDLNFCNRPKSYMFGKLFYNYKDMIMGPYGEYWRQVRSICVVHLLSNKKVQSFHDVRKEETSLMIRKIRENPNCSVNLSEMIAGLANDVLCRVALGKKYREEEKEGKFKPLIDELGELLGVFCMRDCIPWLGWLDQIMFGLDSKADKVAKALDVFLDKVIEEHSRRTSVVEDYDNDGNQKDFVDVLLLMQRDNSMAHPLDRTCIKAIVLDMFAAGSETTYTALEWTMTELLRHQKAMKKLKDEIKEIASCDSKTADIAEEDLEKMDYLKAVIKESLRLHPPLPLLVPRESMKRVEVKGYSIPAETKVIVNAYAIGRDPESWEDADEFKPERFLNNEIDFKGRDSFQMIPFGGGRRGCPAISFSMATMELALANLVHNFDWSLPDGAKAEELDMTEKFGISVHRKFPLMAVPMILFSE